MPQISKRFSFKHFLTEEPLYASIKISGRLSEAPARFLFHSSVFS
ncbi:hypothetical protein CHCC20375_3519 [Bacillus licheniformis]|nr:hypothetical protein CHCC20375_3519 [Bacillus licheniformis]